MIIIVSGKRLVYGHQKLIRCSALNIVNSFIEHLPRCVVNNLYSSTDKNLPPHEEGTSDTRPILMRVILFPHLNLPFRTTEAL